ncbi:hypothetical protein [Luteibacter sp. dw_328]|uniref:hypothetical protein n=1 Tax=Luteibacter sp. dw_328 TaxID=2719796 RepID=UPI001BD39D88|nr:hypothetical protein [Luteibacter sp. dw_328]
MSRFSAPLLAALVATTLISTPTAASGTIRPMTLDEVVIGAIALVSGTSSSVEAFFHAPQGAQRGTVGWVHQPIAYRTRDGVLLHIQLTSDWENKAPDVVRSMAEVDGKQCLDAKKLRDKLEHRWDIEGLRKACEPRLTEVGRSLVLRVFGWGNLSQCMENSFG